MAAKMKQFEAVLDVHCMGRGHVRIHERIEARDLQSARNKAERFARSRNFTLRETATVVEVKERR